MNISRDPMGLSALPSARPQVDSWPVIASVLRRRQLLKRNISWATAAAVAVVAGSTLWQFHASTPTPRESIDAEQVVVQSQTIPEPAAAPGNNLALLLGLSQQLEASLRSARERVPLMPAQSLTYQVEIEDLIAQVDEAINQDPDSLELWSQRVNLLLDLNRIYGKELRRDYGNVASL